MSGSGVNPVVDDFAVVQANNTTQPFTMWGESWTRTMNNFATISIQAAGDVQIDTTGSVTYEGIDTLTGVVDWSFVSCVIAPNFKAYGGAPAVTLTLRDVLDTVLYTAVGTLVGSDLVWSVPLGFKPVFKIELSCVGGTAAFSAVEVVAGTIEPQFDSFTVAQLAGTTQDYKMWSFPNWERKTSTTPSVNIDGEGNADMALDGSIVWNNKSTGADEPIDLSVWTSARFEIAPFAGNMELSLSTNSDGTGKETKLAMYNGAGFVVWPLSAFVVVDLSQIRYIEFKNPDESPPMGLSGGAHLIPRATTGVVAGAGGAEPHIVCLDGSRLEIYHNANYRLFATPNGSVVANIEVVDGYTTKMFVASTKTGAHAVVEYEHEKANDLHATRLTLTENTGIETAGNDQSIVLTVDGINVVVQAMYRSFAVQHDAWANGISMTAGGAMMGLIHTLPALDDVSGLDNRRTLTIGNYEFHALACEADAPHIVSFDGASILPGAGNHQLFQLGAFQINAQMDDEHRLLALDVEQNGASAMNATWARNGADCTLTINGIEEACTATGTVEEATRAIDHSFVIDEKNMTELQVRMQANGAAMFAVRNTTGAQLERSAGLLMQRNNVDEAKPVLGASAVSVYERILEPHLALGRNPTFLPKSQKVTARGVGVF